MQTQPYCLCGQSSLTALVWHCACANELCLLPCAVKITRSVCAGRLTQLGVVSAGPLRSQLIPSTVTWLIRLCRPWEGVVVRMPLCMGVQSQHGSSAGYPRRSPGALDCAMRIDPVTGFMQWHCLSDGVSAKPELINHLGPKITV